jgi:hypothetical protein
MLVKKCCRCGIEYESSLSNFGKSSRSKDGLRGECKKCTALDNKKHREADPEKTKAHKKLDRERHGDAIRARDRAYSKSERGRMISAKWSNENREHKRERRRLYDIKRRAIDPAYKVLTNYRSYLVRVLKGNFKTDKTKQLLGCTGEELKDYLESRFIKGMSWSNYGEWHVDHIRPIKSFDKSNTLEVCECFHYTNLQPLWRLDNLRKGSRNEGVIEEARN